MSHIPVKYLFLQFPLYIFMLLLALAYLKPKKYFIEHLNFDNSFNGMVFGPFQYFFMW